MTSASPVVLSIPDDFVCQLVDSGRGDKQALLIFVDGAGAENLGCQCQLVFCEQKNAQYCFVC